jgi:putative sporulation protein YtxC
MQSIIVDLNENIDALYKVTEKNRCEKFNFIKLDNGAEFSSNDTAFLQLKVAEILTEYIIENEEENLLKMTILSDYPFLNYSEKNKIFTASIWLIKNNENDFLRMLILLKRRFLIKQNILDYLKENSYMNLKGFTSFRLTAYKKMLSELVQKVIEDYKIQQEYKEFISMLKYFVETQKKRCKKLHVVFEENGEYTLLDENNCDITDKCFSEFSETKEKNNLNNEDVLISSLISLAPRKLFLHFESENYNKRIVSTISQIFENKVYISSEPLLEVVR